MNARLSGDAKRFLCKHWAITYLTIEEMENMLKKMLDYFTGPQKRA